MKVEIDGNVFEDYAECMQYIHNSPPRDYPYKLNVVHEAGDCKQEEWCLPCGTKFHLEVKGLSFHSQKDFNSFVDSLPVEARPCDIKLVLDKV